MSKVSRGDKGEQIVISVLNNIKDYHRLINDVTYIFGKGMMSHQIDHILIHPHGVFVIETKNYYGKIVSETHDSFWLKIVHNEEKKISNPLKQNKSHAFVINQLLERKYEVIPVVVFVKNNSPLLLDENIINLKDLELFIDAHPYQKLLKKDDIDKIYKILMDNKSDISKDEHLENISYVKQMKEEFRQEMEYAIMFHLCPRCESEIKIKGNNYMCPKCDFKFKL